MRLTIRRSVFNDSFYPLLGDNEHDVILLVGGGGSGKSYFSFQRAVCRSIQDRRKYLVVRKSATDLRRSCWVDLKNTLAQFKITSLCKVNETNMTVRLPNDSEFLCMGIDDFEKVKSIPNITDVIIEEASEITFDDYSQLKMRLRGNGTLRNQIVLMTNPISKANWIYKFFYEDGCSESNCLVHQSTYKDNRFINETTVRTLEGYKDTNPMFYRVYCLGEFGSISKQVFTNYRSEELDIDELRKHNLQHLVGLDFGFVYVPRATDDDSPVPIEIGGAVRVDAVGTTNVACSIYVEHTSGTSGTTNLRDSYGAGIITTPGGFVSQTIPPYVILLPRDTSGANIYRFSMRGRTTDSSGMVTYWYMTIKML